MKNMIFASDLDRTLIYSNGFLDVAKDACSEYRLVESLDEKPISYMTVGAIRSLTELAKQILFVPVTTRTVAQYQRIELFQTEIKPEYAVACNGGQLLYKGKPDLEWHQVIKRRMLDRSLDSQSVQHRFLDIAHENWILSTKIAEDLFHYAIVNPQRVPEQELCDFTTWAGSVGWDVSLQGRKLYFVSKAVNKWDAVAEIQSRTGVESVVAAGDSLLDLSMLEKAPCAFAPRHGEIMKVLSEKQDVHTHIQILQQEGILASENLLNEVSAVFKLMESPSGV